MNKQAIGIHSHINSGGFPGRYSPPYRPPDTARRITNTSGNLFGGLDDSLLARAEALASADINKNNNPSLLKPDSVYGHTDMSAHNMGGGRGQMNLHGFSGPPPGESMLDQLSQVSMPLSGITSTDHGGMATHACTQAQMYNPVYSHHVPAPNNPMCNSMGAVGAHPGLQGHPTHPGLTHAGPHGPMPPHNIHPHELDCDPRELEAFAEHFKQRRIKLGVTQCDVGKALGNLKLPGVGALSQSTICRFESLTLSHNNMIALKPVLHAWLEEAEKQARDKKLSPEIFSNAADKKRKRTSIAAPEKRSLEAYFAIQPRPSGEKIAQIAEKLDLKKNVVRVWFCNQRQKQKRMKFAAGMTGNHP